MSATTVTLYLGSLNWETANNADFSPGPLTFKAGGTLVNFTGATAKMQVRRSWADATPLIDFGNTAGTTLVNGTTAGTWTPYAPAALMETLNPGTYVWDLVVTLSGITTNWLAGTFEILGGVSR